MTEMKTTPVSQLIYLVIIKLTNRNTKTLVYYEMDINGTYWNASFLIFYGGQFTLSTQ